MKKQEKSKEATVQDFLYTYIYNYNYCNSNFFIT